MYVQMYVPNKSDLDRQNDANSTRSGSGSTKHASIFPKYMCLYFDHRYTKFTYTVELFYVWKRSYPVSDPTC